MEQESDGFWQDSEKALKVGKELKKLEARIGKVKSFEKKLADINALLEIAEISGDDEGREFFDELLREIKSFSSDIEKTKLETLLSGKYDSNNAILTIHAGAGGTEAQDWANMLYRMYARYAEKEGFKTSVLSVLDGDEAGIKSITFTVEGDNAYGFLKCEKGVHRLVRISPFDSNARRHTSFASVVVMP